MGVVDADFIYVTTSPPVFKIVQNELHKKAICLKIGP